MSIKEIQIDSTLEMVSKYHDDKLKREVISFIPIDRIWFNASNRLRETQKDIWNQSLDETILFEQYFFEELLLWFKTEFFTWFDSPVCDKCDKPYCKKIMNVSISDKPYIDNTEVFECRNCKSRYYFERYNNPYVLLKTRKGRCSEFTQMFTAICSALGYDARFIYDINDHAWTEVYSLLQKRWIHCDPSEGVMDKPLMYEVGWRSKPTLIISFSPTSEIQDVTWRYSSNHKEVLKRREPNTNEILFNIVSKHNKLVLDKCSPLRRKFCFKRLIRELAEFMTEPQPTEEFFGRTSGSLEWRKQRGEINQLSLHNGFIFKLQSSKILRKPNYYCMWYSANLDTYIYYWDKGESHIKEGWKSCIYSLMNIMRKEELDWKQTYLCRERNDEPGKIMWKFDFTNTEYLITGLHIKTNIFYLENGVVEFKAFNTKNNICMKNGMELHSSSLFPDNTLTVEVTLSGGNGFVSWQQAQIGRQSNKSGSSVSLGVILYIIKKNY